MQISTTQRATETLASAVDSDPAAWVRACTGNVEMAARAAELVYGCFRTIASQQSALATRVMMLATNGAIGGGTMARPMHPAQATKLSYQSCDMVIGSLIEALETVRQASLGIQQLVLQETQKDPLPR